MYRDIPNTITAIRKAPPCGIRNTNISDRSPRRRRDYTGCEFGGGVSWK